MLPFRLRLPPTLASYVPTSLITSVAAVAVSAAAVLTAHNLNDAHGAGIPARSAARTAAPSDPQLAQFRRFALNALLAPLMDDAEPVRWTTVQLPLFCGSGTSVTVDGRPLQNGAPVPARPFTLRWQMDACSPFGDSSLLLYGPVELTVDPRDGQMAAVVDADALQIAGSTGMTPFAGRFDATLALGPDRPQ